MIEMMTALKQENAQLSVRLKKSLKARFGQSSEAICGAQLSLFLGMLGVDEGFTCFLHFLPRHAHRRQQMPIGLVKETDVMHYRHMAQVIAVPWIDHAAKHFPITAHASLPIGLSTKP